MDCLFHWHLTSQLMIFQLYIMANRCAGRWRFYLLSGGCPGHRQVGFFNMPRVPEHLSDQVAHKAGHTNLVISAYQWKCIDKGGYEHNVLVKIWMHQQQESPKRLFLYKGHDQGPQSHWTWCHLKGFYCSRNACHIFNGSKLWPMVKGIFFYFCQI